MRPLDMEILIDGYIRPGLQYEYADAPEVQRTLAWMIQHGIIQNRDDAVTLTPRGRQWLLQALATPMPDE